MNSIISFEKTEESSVLRYDMDPSFTIRYQAERAKILLDKHLWGFQAEKMCFRYAVQPGFSLRALSDEEPDISDLKSCLFAFHALLEETENALLDLERWIWDLDYWFFDACTETMKGVYIPDQRFSTDFSTFLGQWSAWLIQKSLSGDWKNESLILFLHRLYQTAALIETGKSSLKEFLDAEETYCGTRRLVHDPLVRSSAVYSEDIFSVSAVKEPAVKEKTHKAIRNKVPFGRRMLSLPFH